MRPGMGAGRGPGEEELKALGEGSLGRHFCSVKVEQTSEDLSFHLKWWLKKNPISPPSFLLSPFSHSRTGGNVSKVLKLRRRKQREVLRRCPWPRARDSREATVDGFSKPDVFLVLALAAPPVLLGRWPGWG